jgi:hypothetical protein
VELLQALEGRSGNWAALRPFEGGLIAHPRPRYTTAVRALDACPARDGPLEIVGSQHHRSFSVDWPFEELTRCSLLNRIAQPQKLIYSLICLHLMLAFKIVHRRGADRTPHCLALIKHREINDHPIEIVAQYFASLQRHCKSSVLKRSDYAISAGLAQPAIAASKISEFFEVTFLVHTPGTSP